MERTKRGTANVKWFSTRQKPGRSRKASPQQIVGLRLHEFARLFGARYGGARLPNDDSGRDDIEPVIHHLAALTQPARRAQYWLELWAPWLTLAEQRDIISHGIATARPWKADQLAWRYRVTKEERDMLGLTTIGAIDQGKAARTKRRKERDRQRKAAARRAAGAKPRTEYEAASVEHAKPWIVEGISRRTWYRRRAAPPDTSPATA
jgi:hypothetical protein